MENPRAIIMDARHNGGSPAGVISAVAYLEGINPRLAAQPVIDASEIEGIVRADTAEQEWPSRAECVTEWTHSLRSMKPSAQIWMIRPRGHPLPRD